MAGSSQDVVILTYTCPEHAPTGDSEESHVRPLRTPADVLTAARTELVDAIHACGCLDLTDRVVDGAWLHRPDLVLCLQPSVGPVAAVPTDRVRAAWTVPAIIDDVKRTRAATAAAMAAVELPASTESMAPLDLLLLRYLLAHDRACSFAELDVQLHRRAPSPGARRSFGAVARRLGRAVPTITIEPVRGFGLLAVRSRR